MQVNKRLFIVQKAGIDIGVSIIKIADEYKLTELEVITILATEIARTCKYAIRVERHGDVTIPGDKE